MMKNARVEYAYKHLIIQAIFTDSMYMYVEELLPLTFFFTRHVQKRKTLRETGVRITLIVSTGKALGS